MQNQSSIANHVWLIKYCTRYLHLNIVIEQSFDNGHWSDYLINICFSYHIKCSLKYRDLLLFSLWPIYRLSYCDYCPWNGWIRKNFVCAGFFWISSFLICITLESCFLFSVMNITWIVILIFLFSETRRLSSPKQ